ncbi:hypothetical protein H2199_005765 [Coniosporium tulheliwenetii]|uniref:Uncharacterized protein n=1 Tax=Coniosporium tulheliwenetii TaxID=3383036 RepID=A0ACC2Z1J8_9PEZI|nr:hypothetical protein H2199_005765 [Cladosporium sp. JES 115]
MVPKDTADEARKRQSVVNFEKSIGTAKVSPNQEPSSFHDEPLDQCSSYFITALKEVNPGASKLFMRWLYTPEPLSHRAIGEDGSSSGDYDEASDDSKSCDEESGDDDRYSLNDLLDLYIFAHTYDVCQLKINIMTAWTQQETESAVLISFPIVIRAFENLPSDDPLCEFLIQYFALYWDHNPGSQHFKEYSSELPQAFVLKVLLLKPKSFNALPKDNESKLPANWAEFEDYWRRLQ